MTFAVLRGLVKQLVPCLLFLSGIRSEEAVAECKRSLTEKTLLIQTKLSLSETLFQNMTDATSEPEIPAIVPNASDRRFIYVGVQSAPGNFDRRQQVRQSWLNELRSKYAGEAQDKSVRAEFIVGHIPIADGLVQAQGVLATQDVQDLEHRLDQESQLHNDILRIPLPETYMNLPDKSLQTLGLGVNAGYRYVVKIDDDQHLDVNTTLSFCSRMTQFEDLYAGKYLWDSQSYTSQLGADGKFKQYFSGPAYLLSHALAAKVVQGSSHNASFVLTGSSSEDVDMGRWVDDAGPVRANVRIETVPMASDLPDV